MKKTFFLLGWIMTVCVISASAQINWSSDSTFPSKESWSNYSTSYPGDISDSVPFLVTAIPYNGVLANLDNINTPLDLSFTSSLFRYRSTLNERGRKLYTYDSSKVYFMAPGIFKANAAQYEYRIILNGQKAIVPWTQVSQFSSLALGNFKKEFGFLGGFNTNWGNYIVAELRRKGVDTPFAAAIVYWKETKPVIGTVYTSQNLNEFFISLQRPWDRAGHVKASGNDSVFASGEKNIIFILSAEIISKEAIEYRLLKDDKEIVSWKANDYDNNFIWLKDLGPGHYRLYIRYSRQRHNILEKRFYVKPAWQQTTAFKIIAGCLVAAFLGFIILFFLLRKERRQREQMNLELKSVYAQLNPHFIFNALSSIQGLINKNDPASANHYLAEFGSLLRTSLDNAGKESHSLQQEMALLERYLELEKLRFGFHYALNVDPAINATDTTMPLLLLQPLVENAVKHGVAGMQQEGFISVDITPKENDMHVSIADNGKGFGKYDRQGHGIGLTRERIRLLNKLHRNKHIDLFLPDTDATVRLLFKNWLQ